jgi:hypothetical protein
MCSQFRSTRFRNDHVFTEHKAHQTTRYSKTIEGKFAETQIWITIEAHLDHKMWGRISYCTFQGLKKKKSMSYGL